VLVDAMMMMMMMMMMMIQLSLTLWRLFSDTFVCRDQNEW